jgi:hypothetical protein
MFRSKTIILLAVLVAAIFVIAGGCGKKTQNQSQNANPADTSATTNNAAPGNQNATPNNPPPPPPARVEHKETVREVSLTVPVSTPLNVTLTDSIQTNNNQSGDHIAGVMANAVIIDGKTVIPQGANVDLVITKLVKGGTLKTPPEVAFQVNEVTLADGKKMEVSTNEIYDKGRSHTKREVGMIGGGAVAGGVIGGLLGKGKGAAIGAAAGAAAGTGAAAATGRQNLVYPSGQTVTFSLSQPVTVKMAK